MMENQITKITVKSEQQTSSLNSGGQDTGIRNSGHRLGHRHHIVPALP